MRRNFSCHFRQQGLNGFLDDQASLGKKHFKSFAIFGVYPQKILSHTASPHLQIFISVSHFKPKDVHVVGDV